MYVAFHLFCAFEPGESFMPYCRTLQRGHHRIAVVVIEIPSCCDINPYGRDLPVGCYIDVIFLMFLFFVGQVVDSLCSVVLHLP
jgi:hypothetical protein